MSRFAGKKRYVSPDQRYRLRQALLFWGAFLLLAILIVIWVVIQNMGPSMLRGGGGTWDPTASWHQQLD